MAERDGGEGGASQHQADGGVVAHRQAGQARGYAGITILPVSEELPLFRYFVNADVF